MDQMRTAERNVVEGERDKLQNLSQNPKPQEKEIFIDNLLVGVH